MDKEIPKYTAPDGVFICCDIVDRFKTADVIWKKYNFAVYMGALAQT